MNDEARQAIGFLPSDNAEDYARHIDENSGYSPGGERYHGGAYCTLAPLQDAR
ncbi:hypothetical protein LP414_05880 [Polaromonas sp. P1(28)-13]|nr:hypothetical protein LP414_05880 [Polaromonas sp. P1(28)-13]